MTLVGSPNIQALRDQVLRLTESQREEIVAALLDSLRPPSDWSGTDALGRAIEARAEAYHRGELEAIDLDDSVALAKQAARKRPA